MVLNHRPHSHVVTHDRPNRAFLYTRRVLIVAQVDELSKEDSTLRSETIQDMFITHHCTNMPPTHWLRVRMDPSHTIGSEVVSSLPLPGPPSDPTGLRAADLRKNLTTFALKRQVGSLPD